MATRRIRTRMTMSELRRVITDLPGILAGQKRDIRGIRRAFYSGLAHSLYGDIERAFKLKSDLQSDDLGNQWQDLSPITKALRAARAGDLSKQEARNLKNSRTIGLLDARQTKIWKAIYRRKFTSLRSKGVDKRRAAIEASKTAWSVLKAKYGARTKVQALGNRKLPILNEYGKLQLSLSQGNFNGVEYTPPTRQQIFRLTRNGVTLGSKDKKATKHHHGIPDRLPVRRLWPKNIGPWLIRGVSAGSQAAVNQLARSL